MSSASSVVLINLAARRYDYHKTILIQRWYFDASLHAILNHNNKQVLQTRVLRSIYRRIQSTEENQNRILFNSLRSMAKFNQPLNSRIAVVSQIIIYNMRILQSEMYVLKSSDRDVGLQFSCINILPIFIYSLTLIMILLFITLEVYF